MKIPFERLRRIHTHSLITQALFPFTEKNARCFNGIFEGVYNMLVLSGTLGSQKT